VLQDPWVISMNRQFPCCVLFLGRALFYSTPGQINLTNRKFLFNWRIFLNDYDYFKFIIKDIEIIRLFLPKEENMVDAPITVALRIRTGCPLLAAQ